MGITRKEYLASLTPPLAKIGRGRLSVQANQEIERAIREDGMTFDDYVDGARVVKTPTVTQSKPRTVAATKPVTQSNFEAEDIAIPGDPAPIKAGSYDVAAVRAWGQDNGYTVADKGRVHQSVVRAYMESHDGNLPEVSAAVEDKNRQHMSRVRYADNYVGIDPATSQKVTKTYRDCCFDCSWSIGYCRCAVPTAISHDTTTVFELRPTR